MIVSITEKQEESQQTTSACPRRITENLNTGRSISPSRRRRKRRAAASSRQRRTRTMRDLQLLGGAIIVSATLHTTPTAANLFPPSFGGFGNLGNVPLPSTIQGGGGGGGFSTTTSTTSNSQSGSNKNNGQHNNIDTTSWLKQKFTHLQGGLATLFPYHPDIYLRSIFDDKPSEKFQPPTERKRSSSSAGEVAGAASGTRADHADKDDASTGSVGTSAAGLSASIAADDHDADEADAQALLGMINTASSNARSSAGAGAATIGTTAARSGSTLLSFKKLDSKVVALFNADSGEVSGVLKRNTRHVGVDSSENNERTVSTASSQAGLLFSPSSSRGCVVIDVATAESQEMTPSGALTSGGQPAAENFKPEDVFKKLKLWNLQDLVSIGNEGEDSRVGQESDGTGAGAEVERTRNRPSEDGQEHEDQNYKATTFYSSQAALHVLWLHGKGKSLDPWLLVAEKLCSHYDLLVLEDELLIVAFREKTTNMREELKKCKLVPFDANENPDTEKFHSLPWRPDEILPIQLEGIPLVSFHAHRVFDKEAQRNHHKWLENPDEWTPYFLDMVRKGEVVMCLDAEHCSNDRMPFRLIFTEEIGEEFIECLSQGIIPIYYLSANLASFLERVLLFMPFYFTSPKEMHNLVATLTDGSGILQHGVRMYMTHESNHYLTALYWGQSRFLRFLTAVTSMHYQEMSIVSVKDEITGKTTSSLTGELLVCVHSARKNKRARALIRETWAKGSPLYPEILVRVVFFIGKKQKSSENEYNREEENENDALEEEHAEYQDLVLLDHYDDKFENIWIKTAAIMKFGLMQFRKPSTRTRLRYLMKADDDTFFNIDGIIEDLFAAFTGRKEDASSRGKTNVTEGHGVDLWSATDDITPREIKPTIEIQTVDIGNYESSKHLHTGHYWGFIMALVQPNRNTTDKYYVPYRSFGNEFYPAYARGLGYAMSEDLVLAVGQGLSDGSLSPFPYREDVSVGLYLYSLSKLGRAKVRPMQRKDHMPLEIEKYCTEVYDAKGLNWDLLEIHRYQYDNHECLWNVVSRRRELSMIAMKNPPGNVAAAGLSLRFPKFEPKKKYVPKELDFCQCFLNADGSLKIASAASGGSAAARAEL
ncbi:unnamed protein product [Amoebophrya sp. A120]|nr:unnamed protein product [Amoebophrya sp. A120]|eukprot:GSA120T00014727001.1